MASRKSLSPHSRAFAHSLSSHVTQASRTKAATLMSAPVGRAYRRPAAALDQPAKSHNHCAEELANDDLTKPLSDEGQTYH